MAYKKEEPREKKEIFEQPKMVDLGGKEITKEVLTDEDLEGVSGGGNSCNGGTGGNDCNGGSGGFEEV